MRLIVWEYWNSYKKRVGGGGDTEGKKNHQTTKKARGVLKQQVGGAKDYSQWASWQIIDE